MWEKRSDLGKRREWRKGGRKDRIIGRWRGRTVSSSGFPRQRAMASQNLSAARSTGSAGNRRARFSICIKRSGVPAGTSRNWRGGRTNRINERPVINNPSKFPIKGVSEKEHNKVPSRQLHTRATRWPISCENSASPLSPITSGSLTRRPLPVKFSPALAPPAMSYLGPFFALQLGKSTLTASGRSGISSGSNSSYSSFAVSCEGSGITALPSPTPSRTCTGASPVQPAVRYPSRTAHVSKPANKRYHSDVGTSAFVTIFSALGVAPTSRPSSSATSAESLKNRGMSSASCVFFAPGGPRVSSDSGIPRLSNDPPNPDDASPLPTPAPSEKPETIHPCATGARSIARWSLRVRADAVRPGGTQISHARCRWRAQ